MARHRQQQAATAEETREYDSPAIPGGAAGLPVNEQASTLPATFAPGPERALRAREWMVVDGPRTADGMIPFMSEGYRVNLKPGKIVTEATHDLGLMRRQGIKLELVPLPEEQQPPAEESGEVGEGEQLGT